MSSRWSLSCWCSLTSSVVSNIQLMFYNQYTLLVYQRNHCIIIMWTCHLKWHALDIPHRGNSFLSMCIFHLIDDFILMAFDLRWEVYLICWVPIIWARKATYNWSGNQPHQIWEEYSTSSQGGKCQNLTICGKPTSFQGFFSESVFPPTIHSHEFIIIELGKTSLLKLWRKLRTMSSLCCVVKNAIGTIGTFSLDFHIEWKTF